MKQALRTVYDKIVAVDENEEDRTKWLFLISDGDATNFQEPCIGTTITDQKIENLLNGKIKL